MPIPPLQEAVLKERGEEEEETDRRVQEVERMEKERRLQAAMPMLQTVEAWEEARMEGAKEVVEITPRWGGGRQRGRARRSVVGRCPFLG